MLKTQKLKPLGAFTLIEAHRTKYMNLKFQFGLAVRLLYALLCKMPLKFIEGTLKFGKVLAPRQCTSFEF